MRYRWMKRRYLIQVLVLALLAPSCISMDGIRPARQVCIGLSGIGGFNEDGTKGAVLSSGHDAWGDLENRVNSWAVGLYSSDGLVCSERGGSGTPLAVLEAPPGTGLQVFAVANVPDFDFPPTFEECRSHVFEFTGESITENGVPACGEAVLDPGNGSVMVPMERMVAKIVLTIDRTRYRSFRVTAVSLHDTALDSAGGAVAGYCLRDFDYATDDELVMLDAGLSGSLEFICPENLKGVRPEILVPSMKVSSEAPPHASYLEVRGTVDGGVYGSGEMVYRFYLGSNNTSDFNVRRNHVYRVTLSLDESMMGDYADGGYWKVDSGGFEYDKVEFLWLKDGAPSVSGTLSEGEVARLMIHLPRYMDSRNTLIGLLVGDECCGYEGWNQESFQACLDELAAVDFNAPDLGLPSMSPVEYSVTSCSDVPVMAAGATLPGSSWDFYRQSFPGAVFVSGAEGMQDMIYCLSRVGEDGNALLPDGYEGWYVMEIADVTDSGGTPAAAFVYSGTGTGTAAYPVFHEPVGEPHVDFGLRSAGDLYVGERVPVSVQGGTSYPVWSVDSGSGCVEVASEDGISASIICRREGQARIICEAKPGHPVSFDVTVKKPRMRSWYGWWHDSYEYNTALSHGEDAESVLVESGAYDLMFDGTPNMRTGFWYETDSGERIHYSDPEVFAEYVGAELDFNGTVPGSVGFASSIPGDVSGMYLSSYGNGSGGYEYVQGNDCSRNREKLGEVSFHDLLGNSETWPVHTLYAPLKDLKLGNFSFMDGARPSSEALKRDAESVELHAGASDYVVNGLDWHFSQSGGRISVSSAVLASNPAFKGRFGMDIGVFNPHSATVYGKAQYIDVYLALGIVLRVRDTMMSSNADSGHVLSAGLSPCWYNSSNHGLPDVPDGKGVFAWSSISLNGGRTADYFHRKAWSKYSVQTHASPSNILVDEILYPYVENTMVVPDTYQRSPWTFSMPTNVEIGMNFDFNRICEAYPWVSLKDGLSAYGNIVFVDRSVPIGYARVGNGLYPRSAVLEDGHYVIHMMTASLEYDPVFECR